MKQIQTIEQLSLTSLNVSEYNNFMTRVKTLIDNAGLDKLGIEQADYDEFLAGNMAQNVTTLGLDDMVAQLKQANDTYAALTDERTQAGAAGKLESSKTVRTRMDDEYAALCNIAFANSVVNPTDETAAFVRDLNATIGEVKTRYNQRRAQAAGSTEADTTGDNAL